MYKTSNTILNIIWEEVYVGYIVLLKHKYGNNNEKGVMQILDLCVCKEVVLREIAKINICINFYVYLAFLKFLSGLNSCHNNLRNVS